MRTRNGRKNSADLFGYFYRKHVATLMKAIDGICRPRGKKIGFHAHNNLQLAFAKTVQVEECGADFPNSTLGGSGMARTAAIRNCCSDTSGRTSRRQCGAYRGK